MHCLNKAAVRPTTPLKATIIHASASINSFVGKAVPVAGLSWAGLLLGGLLVSATVWAESGWANFSASVTPQREQPQRRIIGQSGAYHYGSGSDKDSNNNDWGDRRDNARARDGSNRSASHAEQQRHSRDYSISSKVSNRISARFDYHAPSTTIINRSVQVLPPQAGAGNQVGDVYFNQDTYLIYPPSSPYRPNGYVRGYYQPIIPAYNDPKATESRAKQWTDKSDFGGE